MPVGEQGVLLITVGCGYSVCQYVNFKNFMHNFLKTVAKKQLPSFSMKSKYIYTGLMQPAYKIIRQ